MKRRNDENKKSTLEKYLTIDAEKKDLGDNVDDLRSHRIKKIIREHPAPETPGERSNLLEKATLALRGRSYPMLTHDDSGIIDCIPVGIAFAARESGRFIKCNHAYANYLGYRKEELEYEMVWMDLVVEFSDDDLRTQLECYDRFGGDMRSPRKWRHKKGHIVGGTIQYFTTDTHRLWSGEHAADDDFTLELIGVIAYFDPMGTREGIVAAHAVTETSAIESNFCKDI